MNNIEQDAVIVESAQPARYVVIWLHGLGADGHDFEAIVPELQLPEKLPVRFIFPHAPFQPVTINNGYVMRAWYDVFSFEPGGRQDAAGIGASARRITALIDEYVAAGIPSQHIVLAGFSQGGAIALYAGLRYPQPLAGILALSTYLPLSDTLASERHQANLATPVMMAQGSEDTIIQPALAQRSREQLVSLGYQVEWHGYVMPHAVSAQEISDISQWLQKVLVH